MKSKNNKKVKPNVYVPKTILEALRELEVFFDCDIYSKFRPMKKLKGEEWCRQDWFRNEIEFRKYLMNHFKTCEDQIKVIIKDSIIKPLQEQIIEWTQMYKVRNDDTKDYEKYICKLEAQIKKLKKEIGS